jgi:hypothetical protein
MERAGIRSPKREKSASRAPPVGRDSVPNGLDLGAERGARVTLGGPVALDAWRMGREVAFPWVGTGLSKGSPSRESLVRIGAPLRPKVRLNGALVRPTDAFEVSLEGEAGRLGQGEPDESLESAFGQARSPRP